MTAGGLRTAAGWELQRHTGPAGRLHEAAVASVAGPGPATRMVRVLEATDHCVVLGSAQPGTAVDRVALAARGWSLTRRRSGGSAVLVGPGEVLWVDVVVPSGDALWEADVGRACWWLGERWVAALRSTGCAQVEVWRGGLDARPWSSMVCFAGLGPGEVTVAGRKVLGVAQRRTRTAALFQCALLVRWAPADLVSVLALPEAERVEAIGALAPVAAGLGAPAAAVLEAFVAGLPPPG